MFILPFLFALVSSVQHDHHTAHLKKQHNTLFGDPDADLNGLSVEQRKERVATVFRKIDSDQNDILDLKEVKHHLTAVLNHEDDEEYEEDFRSLDMDQNGFLTFEEITSDEYTGGDGDLDDEIDENLREQDIKRFQLSDVNNDELVDLNEYRAWYTPQLFPHMREYIIFEEFTDMNKDEDKFISLHEFQEHERYIHGREDYPDEKIFEMFESLDTNNDNLLTIEELGNYRLAEPYVEEDAKIAIEEVDLNKDGIVSKDEFVNAYELVEKSEISGYGNLLTDMQYLHSEL